ncbi:hypothetical protein GQ457_01G025450 [Hibiscus cannabinus]
MVFEFDLLLAFLDQQTKNMAYLMATPHEGKGKVKNPAVALPVEVANPKGMPPTFTFYSVPLPKGLAEGDSFTFDVLAAQSLTVKLPDSRIESYTKLENTKIHGSEIKYGPYENLPTFSYSPVAIHFESNQPFVAAQELVKSYFFRSVDYGEHHTRSEARPNVRGASAFRYLVANLPPRAHSVYYRDEIGNISTSYLRGDSKRLYCGVSVIWYFILIDVPFAFADGTVALPEGSSDSRPFPTKISHLDIDGRPVVVLKKINVVPEHNQYFQVEELVAKERELQENVMVKHSSQEWWTAMRRSLGLVILRNLQTALREEFDDLLD